MGNKPDYKCVFTYVQSFYRRFARQTQTDPSKRHTIAVVDGVDSAEGAAAGSTEGKDDAKL